MAEIPYVAPFTCSVIPFTYDPSMSVYEILCKVLESLKSVLNTMSYLDVDMLNQDIQDLQELLVAINSTDYPETIQAINDNIGALESYTYGSDKITGTFMGRIYPENSCKSVQGSCLINDNTLLLAMWESNNYGENSTTFYRVTLDTGAVEKTEGLNFSHCGSMCYVPEISALLVCPNYREVSGNRVYSQEMYVVNPTTYQVIRTLTFAESPHGISYDKVTHKLYMNTITTDGTTWKLYEVDIDTFALDYICDLVSIFSQSDIALPLRTSAGFNGVVANDGHIYMLWGGVRVMALAEIDTETGLTSYIKNFYQAYSIYKITEFESCDFTSNGTLIGAGVGKITQSSDNIGVIFAANTTRKFVEDSYDTEADIARNTTHYDPSKSVNYNVFQDGSNVYPYATFVETVSAVENNFSRGAVYVDNSGTDEHCNLLGCNTPFSIYGQGKSVTWPKRVLFRNPISIENLTIINNETLASALIVGSYAVFRQLKITGPNLTDSISNYGCVTINGVSDIASINCSNRGVCFVQWQAWQYVGNVKTPVFTNWEG